MNALKGKEGQNEKLLKLKNSFVSDNDLNTNLNLNRFTFWNGDEYFGEINLVKEKKKLVMEGKGNYKTGDNHTYEGFWENDCLQKVNKIVFPDKTIFSGSLEGMMIEGPGKFIFQENIELETNFSHNKPFGAIYLKDRLNHSWMGNIKPDETTVCCYPLHSFWQSVLNLPFKNNFFYEEAEEEMQETYDTFYGKLN